MNRRERHLRIIENFGRDWPHRTMREILLPRKGFSILSDEGIELLARELLAEVAFSKKIAAHNRNLRAKREAGVV